ncbi:class I SAM-dependent methyltransferase [Methyloprofundus sedimenti]|uniref:class I SAM-dependent methyltransferase n=1 Tax=Methyloprofundus sedimenti TaxID=1420851 RepID=UPI0011815A80|nr:class I SAM-dependent methyltransferase [Methyloprofundus sedimenti]
MEERKLENDSVYHTEVIKEADQLPCSCPTSVNIDVANLYYSFTKMVRPLLVVEIGCFNGFSTLHFAQAHREQGFGRIVSRDAFDWDVGAGKGGRTGSRCCFKIFFTRNFD